LVPKGQKNKLNSSTASRNNIIGQLIRGFYHQYERRGCIIGCIGAGDNRTMNEIEKENYRDKKNEEVWKHLPGW